MRKKDFQSQYVTRLLQGVQNQVAEDNYATYRFGPQNGELPEPDPEFVAFVMDHASDFAAAQSRWDDQASADLCLDLLLYRSLGPNHVLLPTNTPAYREFVATVDSDPGNASYIKQDLMPVRHKFLHLYEIPEYQARAIATNGLLINFLFMKQYQFERNGVRIRPEPGDVVLDCGACWGDTTVLLAYMVGEAGHIHTFEFVPDNLNIFELNLKANTCLDGRVTLCQHPVGKTSGHSFTFDSQGPGTQQQDKGEFSIPAVAIDDYVQRQELTQVDFIKMDIEGSEIGALEGAAETLKRWHPRLAISAYHKWDDLIELPRLIRELVPGYRLYLDHHTIHAEETVVYAIHS